MVARLILVVMLAGAVGGCAEEPDTYALGGSFTTDRTNADFADFDHTLAAHGTSLDALMESDPEQFIIRGMELQQCQDLRDALLPKDYLQGIRECVLETTSKNPDEPVSNP